MNTKVHDASFPVKSQTRNWLKNYAATPGYTVLTSVRTAYRNRSGSSCPNYKALIAAGENATTDLTAQWDTIDYTPMPFSRVALKRGDGQYQQIEYTFEIEGDVILINSADTWTHYNPSVSIEKCDNLAKAKFYAAVRKLTTEMQGLIFLGELRETLHMLRSPAQGLQSLLGRYLNQVKQAKKRNPLGWMNELGQIWLEYSFGWLPFINDIGDAGRAWNHLIEQRKEKSARISVGAALSYDLTSSLLDRKRVGSTWKSFNGPWLRTVIGMLREQHKVRYRGAVHTQVEAPTWQDQAEVVGFSTSQFIPTAWELLPWSFLADYFTNIGDLLDCSVTDLSRVTYVNRSTVRKTEFYGGIQVDTKKTSEMTTGYDVILLSSDSRSTCALKRKQVTRSKGTGITPPTFNFEFSLSDGQLGNIAALLSQAIGIHPQNPPRFRRR